MRSLSIYAALLPFLLGCTTPQSSQSHQSARSPHRTRDPHLCIRRTPKHFAADVSTRYLMPTLVSNEKQGLAERLLSNIEYAHKTLEKLNTELTEALNECDPKSDYVRAIENGIEFIQKSIRSQTDLYEIEAKRARFDSDRTNFYEKWELGLNDPNVSVTLIDITPMGSVTRIKLKLRSRLQTKVLPFKAVESFTYNNSKGEPTSALAVTKVAVFDEHGNRYTNVGSPMFPTEVSPDYESVFEFSVRSPIKAANYLLVKALPRAVGNARELVLRIKLFKVQETMGDRQDPSETQGRK